MDGCRRFPERSRPAGHRTTTRAPGDARGPLIGSLDPHQVIALQASVGNRVVAQRIAPVATTTPTTKPKPGIDKTGFIDSDDGSNIRTSPAESGGIALTDTPMPPA